MKHAAEKIVAVRSRLVKSWAKLRSEDFPSPVQVRWHQKRRRSRLRRAFPGAARLRGSLLPVCRWTVPGGDEVTLRQTATSLPRGGAVPGTPGRGGEAAWCCRPARGWRGERGDLLCKCAVPSRVALAWDDAVKSCAAFVDKH